MAQKMKMASHSHHSFASHFEHVEQHGVLSFLVEIGGSVRESKSARLGGLSGRFLGGGSGDATYGMAYVNAPVCSLCGYPHTLCNGVKRLAADLGMKKSSFFIPTLPIVLWHLPLVRREDLIDQCFYPGTILRFLFSYRYPLVSLKRLIRLWLRYKRHKVESDRHICKTCDRSRPKPPYYGYYHTNNTYQTCRFFSLLSVFWVSVRYLPSRAISNSSLRFVLSNWLVFARPLARGRWSYLWLNHIWCKYLSLVCNGEPQLGMLRLRKRKVFGSWPGWLFKASCYLGWSPILSETSIFFLPDGMHLGSHNQLFRFAGCPSNAVRSVAPSW